MRRLLTAIWEAEPVTIALVVLFIAQEVLAVLELTSPVAMGISAAVTAGLAFAARGTAFSPVTVRKLADDVRATADASSGSDSVTADLDNEVFAQYDL